MEITQSDSPIRFPQDGETYEGVDVDLSVDPPATFIYEKTGVTYIYDKDLKSWTGPL